MQYQVRLTGDGIDGGGLIYAPRDEDGYISRASTAQMPAAIHIDRRLSQQRRLMRKLEASLDTSPDDGTRTDVRILYDKLKERHRRAMSNIIADIRRSVASGA